MRPTAHCNRLAGKQGWQLCAIEHCADRQQRPWDDMILQYLQGVRALHQSVKRSTILTV